MAAPEQPVFLPAVDARAFIEANAPYTAALANVLAALAAKDARSGGTYAGAIARGLGEPDRRPVTAFLRDLAARIDGRPA